MDVTEITDRNRDFPTYSAHRTGRAPDTTASRAPAVASVAMIPHRFKKLNPWYILGAVAVATLLACSGGTSTDNGPTPPPATTPGEVTLAEFNGLKQGMTFDEVTALFGAPGERTFEAGPLSSYRFPGNSFASYVSVSFDAGRVSSFSQAGLR